LNASLTELYRKWASKSGDTQNLKIEQCHLAKSNYWSISDKVFIEHQFETQIGFGGCPIVMRKNNESMVIGIHVVKRKDSRRIGRLITDDLTDWLITWSR
jgi:Na+-translocating ferredoxin:NAD+ oxidoreductase RnfG subunit